MPTKEKSVAQQAREMVKNRLKDIRQQIGPLVSEETELVEQAPGETVQFGHNSHEAPAPQPKATPAASEPKAKRSRKGGTRAEHAVKFIGENPGASASDIAKALKMKPNYLYRVLKDLEKNGEVTKDGTKYTVSA